jgi:ribosome assembly protein YihI (activator of Der GTPase)
MNIYDIFYSQTTWTEQTNVDVLLDYIETLVSKGVISSDDFANHIEEKVNEDFENSNPPDEEA